MSEYNFKETEKKWQNYWAEKQIFKTDNSSSKPKYYTLDMFPYPSGAGLHVGHPLGYIATDIVARYKRLKGYNVLHPMGYDSFGLPAEQYAVQTGQHPAITTEKNISRYKEQLDNLGFSFDWSREIRTSNPDYYKWTQWIFIQLFKSWYNKETDKAEPIAKLISAFEKEGNANIHAVCDEDTPPFTADDWKGMSEKEQQEMLLKYRLTYLSETMVNWCPALGTVLANEEVKDGRSERGDHPVERKKMAQWSMRITAYAERLLQELDKVDWPEPMKEMQRNWIGKSLGAELNFKIENSDIEIKVFTTRIDTTYGVTFLTLAPENELVAQLTTPELKKEVEAYVEKAKNRSERDRMSDVKTISGQFTGSYAINPFNGERIPVWIADYVLAGYGTGAVMAVPSSDPRDYNFAKHFNLPIIPVQEGEGTDISKEDFDPKKGTMVNSGILNGLTVEQAIPKAIEYVEQKGIGKAKINYKMRDSIFSRQRYWGEPIPVYFKDGIPYVLEESELPLELPEVDEYKPTETGEPPLGRASNFQTKEGYPYELSTMPGWAGSSWYYLRYMDPKNTEQPFSKDAVNYWGQVDLYIGGAEHATGHLLYSRFWNKFLFDLGLVPHDEPFKKLINQGMIQGRSNFVYRVKGTNKFVSYGLRKDYDITPLHVDVNIVENDILDTEAFRKWRPEFENAEFITEDGKYICGSEVEKMSKSKYNVVNPDDMVEKYGADTLRMYEMFLGPLEQFKPWNTNGIDGVFKFIRRFWNLFHDGQGNFKVSEEKPSENELKVLHKTIKKIEEDIERYSFNTSVSTFMICVNELTSLKCNKKSILQDLLVILAPYAPHITEELWNKLGHTSSIANASFPTYDESYVKENNVTYPISVNGKVRVKLQLPADMSKDQIEQEVLKAEQIQKWLEGKQPKKVIVVPNKIVNLVI
ncbi:leucine--tRNA ligase [Cytophagaceae bacterium ABcell3]|nr:leucine--tRNA ligase [Cytophagaceae bacterium ABcell3]